MKKSIIHKIEKAIETGKSIDIHFGNGGRIKWERKLPFLLVYRSSNIKNSLVANLIKSEVSFLVTNSQTNFESEIVAHLTQFSKSMALTYRSVIIMEIWENPNNSTHFKILAGKGKTEEAVKSLKNSLQGYTSNLALTVKIENTKERHPAHLAPLMTLSQCRAAGVSLIGLEIPDVFRDKETDQLFPMLIKEFQMFFSSMIRKAIFEFLRVQTSFDLPHYMALGTTTIDDQALTIEKQLLEIEDQYQFLLLISPINALEANRLYLNSERKTAPKFIYRILPIDPDQLKEELFKVPIRSIDDPIIKELLLEKREELEKQITMLKERGSRHFMHSSIRLYDAVDASLYYQAIQLLESFDKEADNEEDWVDAESFRKAALEEIKRYQNLSPSFCPEVLIKDDIIGLLVSKGNLYIGKSLKIPKKQLEALIHHEIGTHSLTYFNGTQQPLKQLSSGLAAYDELQEGLAVFAEYLCGGLTVNRLKVLAGRVIAAHCLTEGMNFQATFNTLINKHDFDAVTAFDITARIHQAGGFTKDIIYLRGLIKLLNYIAKGNDIELLFIGKIAFEHTSLIKDLKIREIIKPPTLLPRYLKIPSCIQRLHKAKAGIELTELVQ
ncbi:DUF1704 domain-containing protein [Belliella sp. DSM 111904]|uniref:DUF1704 domain-containing protein n=1 Tax=Belliella filtrata TaxID=2923435 RepID=A0ABS9V2E4_9BACT|nr:tyrosine/phenylalanine carboxypeptidase domain-containing protein [Belliella filtrata]MCH7410585.1 DUF1704 domain-containing protein [Belliella filtrata]